MSPISRYFPALLLTGAALSVIACDLEDLEAEDWSPRSEIFDKGLDPTPGGGTCEECITDMAYTSGHKGGPVLELCIDTRILYTGTRRTYSDDRSFYQLFDGPDPASWKLLSPEPGGGETTHCHVGTPSSPACTKDALTPMGSSHARLRVQLPQGTKVPTNMNLLQFTRLPGLMTPTNSEFPAMRIPAPDDNGFHCGESGTEGKLPVGPVIPASLTATVTHPSIAHITLPSRFGGVRSCTGVLIAPRHILTARHCVNADELNSGATLIPELVAPSDIEVTFLALSNSPVQSSVVSVVAQPSPSRDLALLVLDAAVDPQSYPPVPLAAPEMPLVADDELVGIGVGVSEASGGAYDWGRKRTVPLKPTAPSMELIALLDGHLSDLLFFDSALDDQELCRGDSGSPVLRRVGDSYELVAITVARAFDKPSHEDGPGLEAMSRAFAFSRGNLCGSGDLVAYVAHSLSPATQDWIQAITLPPSISPPPPVTE